MTYLNALECCGAAEMCEVRDSVSAETNLQQFYGQWLELNTWSNEKWRDGPCLVFFSVIWPDNKKSGENLKKYIAEHKLGSVRASRPVRNPNTGNKLRGYLWAVNARNYNRLAKKKGWKNDH